MAAVSFYLPYQIAAKPTNVGAPGAKAYFFVPGSTTLRPVYATSSLTTQLSNPVIADGAGRFPDIYLDAALTYKLVINDKNGAKLFTKDPYIPGVAPDSTTLAPYQAAAAASAVAASTSASASATSATASADLSYSVSGFRLGFSHECVSVSRKRGRVASGGTSGCGYRRAFAAGTLTAIELFRYSPEMFANQKASGVIGDGTDDGPALYAAAAAVSSTGGAYELDGTQTYWVGGQTLHNPGLNIDSTGGRLVFLPELPLTSSTSTERRGP
jgi:hypothetical protein